MLQKTSCCLFEGLTPAEQAALLAAAPPPVHFEKGTHIYSTHSFQRAVGLVISGRVAAIRAAAVLNRLGPGDLFGAATLYGDEEEYATEVVARTACQVQFFSQALLEEWMKADFRIAENYIRFLSGRIRFLNRRIAAFTAGSANQRLLLYLQQHADEEGQVKLRSMTELARMLDMSRTSLYRSFEELAALGHLRREGKKIFLVERGESL